MYRYCNTTAISLSLSLRLHRYGARPAVSAHLSTFGKKDCYVGRAGYLFIPGTFVRTCTCVVMRRASNTIGTYSCMQLAISLIYTCTSFEIPS